MRCALERIEGDGVRIEGFALVRWQRLGAKSGLRALRPRARGIGSAGLFCSLVVAALAANGQERTRPLQVCATVPDLGSIAREVGGAHVEVTEFAKGAEDPHFLEAKPSFVKRLSEADLFIQIGMELERAWAPVLLQSARNSRVLPGAPGHLDASRAILPLDVPSSPVDRSMGDVHPFGNPHYLLDPVNGLKVARAIRDRLADLRPDAAADFDLQLSRFRAKLGTAMVGSRLSEKYDVEKLAILFEHGRLESFLGEQGEERELGGWFADVSPHARAKAVADHNLWPYFARRFRLDVIGFMEPKPGISPTTRHLQSLIEQMRTQGARIILAASYYDPRHARFLSEQTGATVVPMAQQTGARPGAEDYVGMIDYNVRQVVAALETSPQ